MHFARQRMRNNAHYKTQDSRIIFVDKSPTSMELLVQPSPVTWPRWLACLLLLCLLCACKERLPSSAGYQPQFGSQPAHQVQQRQIRVGIHPLHNPALLFKRYGPLVERLNARIPQAYFTLEASRSYQDFEDKLARRQLDIALPNPYQALQAQRHGYRVFGKMGDDSLFRGLVLVRADSPVQQPSELRSQAISFPSSTALAATMLPQLELHRQGLPFGSYQVRYVGSQESSIMHVILGDSAAGATWPVPWISFQHSHPQLAQQLRVLLQTPALVNNALVARDDLPPPLLEAISQVFFTLQADAAGQAMLQDLGVPYFERAGAHTYQPVQQFLDEYGRQIYPIEQAQQP